MQNQGTIDSLLLRVVRGAWWVIALVAGLTVLAVTRIVDVQTGQPLLLLDPSINSMLPRDDASRNYYDHVRRLFGSDEMLLVALKTDDAPAAVTARANLPVRSAA